MSARVMVVENNAGPRRHVMDVLARGGLDVVATDSPTSARAKARTERIDGAVLGGTSYEALDEYLRWIAETLAEHGLAARVSLCLGTGARAIADAARLWAADLVIMAAHDFGGPPGEVKHLARTVMQRAAVPVLLVPAPGTNTAHEDRLVEWRGWRGAGTGQDRGHAPLNEGGQA